MKQPLKNILVFVSLWILSSPLAAHAHTDFPYLLLNCKKMLELPKPADKPAAAVMDKDGSKDRTEEQRMAIDQVLAWMNANGWRLPTQYDYSSSSDSINLDYQKLMGEGHYKEGGRARNSRTFDSPVEFWIKLQSRAREMGIPIPLIDVTFRKMSPELRSILQSEAIERVFAWMTSRITNEAGKVPSQLDFGNAEGKIHLNYSQLMGVGKFKDGRKLVAFRIFDSQVDFWIALKRRAYQEGVVVNLTDVRFSQSTPVLREILKKDSLDLIIQWVQVENRIPKVADFGNATGKIKLTYRQLVGEKPYRQEDKFGKYRIFDSPVQFWLALQSRASMIGLHIPLVDIIFREPSPELREVLKAESLDLVVEWMQRNQWKRPGSLDFAPENSAPENGKIKLSYHKLVGVGNYNEEGMDRGFQIFDSPEDFWVALEQRVSMAKAGMDRNGLKMRVLAPL